MKDEQWWRDEGCRIDATQDDTRERGWVLRRLVGASASESFSRCFELLLHSSSYLYSRTLAGTPFPCCGLPSLLSTSFTNDPSPLKASADAESQMQVSEFDCRIFPVEIERDVA